MQPFIHESLGITTCRDTLYRVRHFIELIERTVQLNDFIKANTHIRSSHVIAETMNSTLSDEQLKNCRFRVTIQDMHAAQQKDSGES